MRDTFDLAIVGGGPAGSACALAASRAGLTVALFEAQRELGDKPCGEGLMPPGIDALRELGLDELVISGQPFGRLRYVLPGVLPIELAMPRPGLAIDRPHLARGLEAALRRAEGVARFHGRVEVDRLREEDLASGFQLSSPAGTVHARVLVAADGLSGKSTPWLRPGATARDSREALGRVSRLGLRARYRVGRPLDAVEIHLGHGSEVYLTPLTEDRVNVAVLVSDPGPDSGGREAILARALAEHPRVAERLSDRVTEPEARVLGGQIPSRVAHEGTLLAGDAGGGIDPILGCGVTLALESGILAAHAAREIVDGDVSGRPERHYAREYRARTRMRQALAAFLLALSNHPLLARGTAGIVRWTPGALGTLLSVAAGGS